LLGITGLKPINLLKGNEFKLLFGVMVNNPIYGTVAQITDAIKSDNSMDPIGTHNFSI
jgi:hypothetical protein